MPTIQASRTPHPSSGPASASARSYRSTAARDSILRRAASPAFVSASTARSASVRSFGWRSSAGAGGLLQMERDRPRVPTDELRAGELVGHAQVQALALALGERVVGDVAQHVAAEPPHARDAPRRGAAAPRPPPRRAAPAGARRSATARPCRTGRAGRPMRAERARARPGTAGRSARRSPPGRSRAADDRSAPGPAGGTVRVLATQHPGDLDDEQRVAAGVDGHPLGIGAVETAGLHRQAQWRARARAAPPTASPRRASPPAQFGRSSRNSQRATHTTSSGTRRASFTSCSIRSSSSGSA